MVWSNKVVDGNNEVCVEEEHVQHIYRRRGQQPMEGCGQPLPLFPLHGGGNPLLHGKVTPLIK
jgi:hypothetical protein